jgi:hypothetical protein
MHAKVLWCRYMYQLLQRVTAALGRMLLKAHVAVRICHTEACMRITLQQHVVVQLFRVRERFLVIKPSDTCTSKLW